MRWLGFLIGLLCAVPSWAATWYVRPSTAEYGAEDGSSYAAAYDGLGDITWGLGGVTAGDTLTICGTFLQSSANTANSNLAMMQVAASGSEGSEIVIDGDCSASGNLAVAVLDGDYTSGSVIRPRENTYLRLKNLDLSGAKDAGITAYLSASNEVATAKHITVESSVTIHDIHGGASNMIGITWSGTNVDIGDYSTTGDKIQIYDIGTDGLFSYSGGDQFIDGANIYNISTDDVNGDCVQIQRDADGTQIHHLDCDKSNKDSKQCVVVSSLGLGGVGAQTDVVDILRMHCVMASGTVSNGVYAEGQTTVRQSYIEGGGNYSLVAALDNATKVTAIGNILVNPGVGCVDAHKTSAGGTFEGYHNTCWTSVLGFDFDDATASHIARNNIIAGSPTIGINKGASGTTEDHNIIHGATIAVADSGTEGTPDATDSTDDPLFVNPPIDFRLRAGSPAKGAGSRAGPYHDYRNCLFGVPVNIGAYATCGGDEAEPRTAVVRQAASTRTAATREAR